MVKAVTAHYLMIQNFGDAEMSNLDIFRFSYRKWNGFITPRL
jgi:hypothetical protein